MEVPKIPKQPKQSWAKWTMLESSQPGFKLYCKTWSWHKTRHVDHWDREARNKLLTLAIWFFFSHVYVVFIHVHVCSHVCRYTLCRCTCSCVLVCKGSSASSSTTLYLIHCGRVFQLNPELTDTASLASLLVIRIWSPPPEHLEYRQDIIPLLLFTTKPFL